MLNQHLHNTYTIFTQEFTLNPMAIDFDPGHFAPFPAFTTKSRLSRKKKGSVYKRKWEIFRSFSTFLLSLSPFISFSLSPFLSVSFSLSPSLSEIFELVPIRNHRKNSSRSPELKRMIQSWANQLFRKYKYSGRSASRPPKDNQSVGQFTKRQDLIMDEYILGDNLQVSSLLIFWGMSKPCIHIKQSPQPLKWLPLIIDKSNLDTSNLPLKLHPSAGLNQF